jgi:hypothetical protein
MMLLPPTVKGEPPGVNDMSNQQQDQLTRATAHPVGSTCLVGTGNEKINDSARVVVSVGEYLQLINALKRISENDDIRHGYGYTGCGCSSVATDALPTAPVSGRAKDQKT